MPRIRNARDFTITMGKKRGGEYFDAYTVREFCFFKGHNYLSFDTGRAVVRANDEFDITITVKIHLGEAHAYELAYLLEFLHDNCPMLIQCVDIPGLICQGFVVSKHLKQGGLFIDDAVFAEFGPNPLLHAVAQTYVNGETVEAVLSDESLLGEYAKIAGTLRLGIIDWEHVTWRPAAAYPAPSTVQSFPFSAIGGTDQRDWSIFTYADLQNSQYLSDKKFNGRGHLWMRFLYDVNLKAPKICPPFDKFVLSVMGISRYELKEYFFPLEHNAIAHDDDILLSIKEFGRGLQYEDCDDEAFRKRKMNCAGDHTRNFCIVVHSIFKQMLNFSKACVAEGIWHFDLKLSNILVRKFYI